MTSRPLLTIMFDHRVETVSAAVTKYRFSSSSRPLGYDQAIFLWRENPEFRSFFLDILSASSYTAYRFETPPLSRHKLSRLFEFVLIDSPWLDVPQDKSPFAEHFDGSDRAIIEFDNLGGDATLVVPCPLGSEFAYSHLAAFVRSAPETQKHMLWRQVGRCIMNKLDNQCIWLNTAGGGVDWLHVRLDSKPKYYAYAPYRND